ncbi:hypothetical protein PFY10_19660 [Chryseobacterium daecheongense]|nr:hypothetical protein PFY10_19495 [Chryseobacterium daecheongense]WBV56408.1 hypothetical protein PFY10_19660 [Chryseobacterium daecheongense]
MKRVLLISMLFIGSLYNGQIAIGKSELTNESVSLEFSGAENRGLILPYVEDKTGITENGTFIFDTTDKKVKLLSSGVWHDLSVDPGGVVDLSDQKDREENADGKVGIGKQSAVMGILVLEDSDKAMILPKVASPHLNIINPSAGMMVYDTVARQLAVYNGSVWSFWKP